jgi:hypothetical protein
MSRHGNAHFNHGASHRPHDTGACAEESLKMSPSIAKRTSAAKAALYRQYLRRD